MKRNVLDVLTGLALVATALVWLFSLVIFINPKSGLNPLAPPTLPPLLSFPSFTPTIRRLPPTWTPGTGPKIGDTVQVQPSSTQQATATLVFRNTFTITPTQTLTPTITPTITNTPTVTRTPSRSPTQNLTATELSKLATSIAETEAAQ